MSIATWRRNAKGNFTAFFGGKQCTVFRSKYEAWSFVADDVFSEPWFDSADEAIEAVEDGLLGAAWEASPIFETPPCLSFFGLAADASVDDVKAAYRRWARATHPDRGGDAAAFKEGTRHFDAAMRLMEVAA